MSDDLLLQLSKQLFKATRQNAHARDRKESGYFLLGPAGLVRPEPVFLSIVPRAGDQVELPGLGAFTVGCLRQIVVTHPGDEFFGPHESVVPVVVVTA
jgi:hypothetical protein